MNPIHQYVGLSVGGLFALLALMGLVLWIRNVHAGKSFWTLLAVAQVGVAIQVLIGFFMLVTRGGMPLLHYVYGAFPVLVLVVTHRISRRTEGIEWVPFAVAGLIIFGLQLRGYMTGGGA
ncbi:MAG: hypothetical protein M3164_02990 [Actinomycetota bacterium]|nr:hypothetical protein [Actinomycetota bacterium]